MFLRVLLGLALLAAAIWIVAYVTGEVALHRETSAQWPYHLGSIDDVAARPRPRASPEWERLAKVIETLRYPKTQAWIAEQVKKKDDDVDPAPGDLASALAENEPKAAEVVRLAIASGDRIILPVNPPMRVYVAAAVETLAVLALERARAGDGAAAWDDVHAMWILSSALSRQPLAFSKELAQELERLANAVARKLPPPAPPWLEEMTGRDPRPDAAASLQAETALWEPRRHRSAAIVAFLFKPLIDRFAARGIRDARRTAEAMTARCRVDDVAVNAAATTGLPPAQIVYRAARMDAEREATAKVLALKGERARLGRWPPPSPAVAASRCAENVWQYEVSPDRSMSLRMSLEPASEPSAKIVPQLDFRY
jgi:hypothetical protein